MAVSARAGQAQVRCRALHTWAPAPAAASDPSPPAKGAEIEDLSHHSTPLGNLFGQLPRQGAAWWKAQELTQEQVRSYQENGYLSGVYALSAEQVEVLRRECDGFTDPANPHPGMHLFHEFHFNETNDPNAVLMHALGHWRVSPNFHDLPFLPNITVPTSQLLLESPTTDPITPAGLAPAGTDADEAAQRGKVVRFWHDQLFVKPGGQGGPVAWHQDYSYWTRTGPMNHMTVHIALDDQTVDNGTLHFIPGSHKWHRDGRPLPITSLHFDDMDSILEILTPEERAAFKPVPSLLRAGQVSFHHPLTVHGSFGNKSDGPRRAAVVNYFADGTATRVDEELLEGVPASPAGTPLSGRFFPIVHDPAWRR